MSPVTPASSPHKDIDPARGRRMAWLLFGVGFGPMLIATLMYYSGFGIPSGRVNHGELIAPAQMQIQDSGLQLANGQPLASQFGPQVKGAKWMLLVIAPDCDSACADLLHLTRQVQIALGRDADRVHRALWQQDSKMQAIADDPGLLQVALQATGKTTALPGETGEAAGQMRLLLIDPLGNLVLRYSASSLGKAQGKGLLQDLQRLLKLSNIG